MISFNNNFLKSKNKKEARGLGNSSVLDFTVFLANVSKIHPFLKTIPILGGEKLKNKTRVVGDFIIIIIIKSVFHFILIKP